MTAKEMIARRIAREIQDGFYVNLGIGLPTMIASYVAPGIEVVLHSENGLLGIGPPPRAEEEDPDLINAGKQTVTAVRGASYFGSEESFAMVRGGHMDMTVLGGMQVSRLGDLANWWIPGRMLKGMGGAMDLVAGARRVIVAMQHNAKDGGAKIVEECSLPLTGRRVVHDVVTELGWFTVGPAGLTLEEIAEGVTVEEVRARTGAGFAVADGLRVMAV